ncbi:hypothetical protein C1J03_11730 [Sulfitobacter sp. SK012]|uniref:bestrophin-like domain n=1 Tax=Sulfitobacter sp. SK012 TaxID=1389005 RepID=UPI000E0AF4B5|nr:DUF4239 domain-containing protein [Sulfitobacter sp. SK012]AXI46630.1 hypothetical protein C1J03_11730 [Sulfitobacter sp. SK012]
MPDFIFDVPLKTLAIWCSVIAICAMVFGLLIVKPLFRLLIGTGPDFNNSVNHATSTFSLFYGLLLGLLTVAAYQNSEHVRESINNEATSLAGLYAQMGAYPEPTRSDVKWLMRDYTLFTIHKEFPAHRKGEVLNGGFNRADAIRRSLSQFEPGSDGQRINHQQAMSAFQEFATERQKRLTGVTTEIPDVLWYAVLVGAVINILLLVLLKMRQLAHFVLGTITASFLGVILFVIVTLDRPLRGEAGLAPVAYQLVWDRLMVWDEPLVQRGE